jgi:hypothetical protein
MASKEVEKILREEGLREAGDTGVFVVNMDKSAPAKQVKKLERDAIKRAKRLK